MNISEFCSANYIDKNNFKEFVFQISENISLTSECYIDVTSKAKSKIESLIFGDYFIKGKMVLKGEIDIIIFNSNIIDELEMTLEVIMPQSANQNNIIVPSIITYEDSKPKSLYVSVSNYSKEIENFELESKQFLKGICMDTTNNIPLPYTRDFRIRPICSNIDGIFGMKIKTLTQKYNQNQICFYDTSLSKCIYNTKLENYLPVKYSEIPPSFVKGNNEPSIYIFDSPKSELVISFQYASLINLNTATIVNNDNAKTKIFIPFNYVLSVNETSSSSDIYFQFKYGLNNYKYGTLNYQHQAINIHPIPFHHATFIYEDKLVLTGEDTKLSSNLGQNNCLTSNIKYDNESIIINGVLDNYDDFDDNIYSLYNDGKSKIVRLSSSKIFKPYDIHFNRLGIQSTVDNTLTFDLSKRKNLEGSHIFISEVRINFTKEADIDFEDLNITFHKCNLDKKWINRIAGRNLFFDNESYYSFYDKTNKISAFKGDHIQIQLPDKISLQKDEFKLENTTFVQLSSFNAFSDYIGKILNFTGNNSILSIDTVTRNTLLNFHNFTQVTIITDAITEYASFYHVKACILQVASDTTENYIDTIEVGLNDHTEIKSNGIIIVKKLIVSSDYNASTISRINETEIMENNNITLKYGTFANSISIKNNSFLTLISCSTIDKIKIKFYGQLFDYPRLILGSNNTIGINSIILNLTDQDILTQSYLIKGLSNCKKIKSKVHVFKNLDDIKNKYKIKCKDDSLYINMKSGLSKGAIAGITVASVVVFIVVVIIIIKVINKNKSKDDNTDLYMPIINEYQKVSSFKKSFETDI